MTDLGTEIQRIKTRLAAVERASRLGAAAIDDTAVEVRDNAGGLRALVGQQGDGTTAVNVVNGPTPAAPTAPLVASVIGGVAAEWDGQLVGGGGGVPLDFARVEVHAAASSGFTPAGATLVGTIETAQGAIVVIPTINPVYVRLVTRTTSGTASAPSAENGPIAPALIVADDVADGIITGTKLAADAIDGKTITGATVRTAASGQRITLTPEGRLYLHSGAPMEVFPAMVLSEVLDVGAGYGVLKLIGPAYAGTEPPDISLYMDGTGAKRWDVGPLLMVQPYGGPYDTIVSGTVSFADPVTVTDDLDVTGALTGTYGQFSEEGTWTNVTFSQWKQSTNSTYQTLRCSRGAKRARLDGCAMVSSAMSAGVAQNVCTVPAGYRPTKAHYFTVPFVTATTPPVLGCRVGADGVVTVWSSAARAVDDLFDFSKVDWPLN
ncbi:hypothetical protein ACH4TP_37785 [Streptomyces sp. NPDC021012]|uniref:hypothetical protein n=1 Tax=Streptomyces sp. NPDC021012 TaxID=3365107 RepID=UPI00379FB748